MAKVAPLGPSKATRLAKPGSDPPNPRLPVTVRARLPVAPTMSPKKPIAGPQSFSELDDKAVIEIIFYGRSHRYEYSPKLWEILAPILARLPDP